jgi:Ca-activated chloride channel family protein
MNVHFEAATGLYFLDPWLLLSGLLIVAALIVRRRRKTPAILLAPFGLFLTQPGGGAGGPPPRSLRVRLLWVPRALQVLALLLIVFAVARPVERDRLPFTTEGIDILLCLDRSSSMAAKDMDPLQDRLDVAKATATRFMESRPHDRIGLVTFARYPDVLCPLTLDHAASKKILAGVKLVAKDGPEDATGIGTAVARAAQVLRRSVAKSKVVILLSDGEENVATAETPDEIGPERAGRLCTALGVRVYTIAAGVKSRDPEAGSAVIDTSQVKRLADQTGGGFYEAKDKEALAGVYASIDTLEKVEQAEPRYRVKDRFLPFLLAAVALFLMGRFLEGTLLGALP